MRNDTNEYLGFLDYPHAHDPTHVSHVAALPTDLLRQLPSELQDLLWGLQESTSIVYASNERLQELVEEKFDRLSLSPGSEQYSEISFNNYTNQLSAERDYFFDEAYQDWKHKASSVRLEPYFDLNITFKGKQITIREWYTDLQHEVIGWAGEARAAEIPDFEDTIWAYTSQAMTPVSATSSSSLTRVFGAMASLPNPVEKLTTEGVDADGMEAVSKKPLYANGKHWG